MGRGGVFISRLRPKQQQKNTESLNKQQNCPLKSHQTSGRCKDRGYVAHNTSMVLPCLRSLPVLQQIWTRNTFDTFWFRTSCPLLRVWWWGGGWWRGSQGHCEIQRRLRLHTCWIIVLHASPGLPCNALSGSEISSGLLTPSSCSVIPIHGHGFW